MFAKINMKKLVVIIFCLISFIPSKAQKDFEGKIVYLLHNDTKKNEDAELTILFAKNKIRLSLKDKKDSASDLDYSTSIINIDSGKIFTLNTYDSSYSAKKLIEKHSLETPTRKLIAGYAATSYIEDSKMSILGYFKRSSNLVFYISDSLNYTLPEKYSINPEFLMINKNKIVLGAEMYVDFSAWSDENDSTKNDGRISIEATRILPMQMPDSAFEIPSYYFNSKDRYGGYAMADSTKLIMDSVVKAPKKQTTKKGGHKPPPLKKTTPIKSSAIIRKP